MASDDNDAITMEEPLLVKQVHVEGVVDHKGRKASKCRSGGWKSASFTIAVEVAERFAFYGVSANLVTYLTGPLHQSTATAAANVNAWNGCASMLPLLGAFVADSYLGCYLTILYSTLIYVLGLGLLTLSVMLTSSSCKIDCGDINTTTSCHTSSSQLIFFFTALYIVAIAQGGHKPCIQAFGAEQFDKGDPNECKSKSSFFNWFYFGLCTGTVLSYLILFYIQENLSWGLGIAIPCISMVISLIVFLFGAKTYRYSIKENGTNPFVRIMQVFIAAARNWRSNGPSSNGQEDVIGTSFGDSSHQFKFLDKALVNTSDSSESPDDSVKAWKVCTRNQVEEAKGVLKLVPIWFTCLVYAVTFAQSSTMFTKQGSTMDRSIGSKFQIPAASLQTFTTLTIVLFMPIYDCMFVPLIRLFTGRSSGVTTLQRIGLGMFFSFISMIVAALVEKKRLKTALEHGVADIAGAMVPMRVWWLLPQYIICGVSRAFTMVGLQEFFYDQVPDGLRSLGIALYMSVFGVGSFLSSFLIFIIEKVSDAGGRESWFCNNLNKGHLDYFYWLLAGLSTLEMISYLYFAKSYAYNRSNV